MQPIGEVDAEGNAAWGGGGEGVEAWFSCGWRPRFEPPVSSVVDSAAPRTVAGMQ